MWALRRASVPLRNRGFGVRASRATFPGLKLQHKDGVSDSPDVTCDKCLSFKRSFHEKHDSANLYLVRRSLSSQAGAKSNGEEYDLEDGFSELETTDGAKAVRDTNVGDNCEDELISEPDLSDNEDHAEPSKDELEISDTEADFSEKAPYRKRVTSALFKAIVAAPGLSVSAALDKWVEEGDEIDRGEISLTMLNLRKLQMYGRALQFSEWLEASKRIELIERDYSSHLDLIAKVHGPEKAAKYIEKIPKSFRGELIYRTLLANYVKANNVKKAEEVFNKMKDLEFPITTFSCNQLLLLYKRTDKKKLADVLLLMEKENVKPSLFTFRLLIDTKGQMNDISGMEELLEKLKVQGFEPDIRIKSIAAGHYVSAGLKEKAEAVLKDMERGNLSENRRVCGDLLRIYALLGQADQVERIWKFCESNPWTAECIAAIEAWGKLKKIKEAEAVFEKMLQKVKRPSSKHYTVLLKVYADHKMMTKGKDLIKRMADDGCNIGPQTWDALVKLYLDAGEIEKADSILHKASQKNQVKPFFRTFMAVMDHYSKRGDVHNSEKIFHRMRQAGYIARLRQFQALVQAYINAKAPAYGIRERMKADNIFPNRDLAGQLVQVDAFRKTAASDLLE
ncbi:pentatricopeptide repeat-containing protein At1g80270, mitochondrial-like [Humulus lupulus]|uniref:pentatricopeptide repeat-containing protein At1g80270, mitochondrial-like n=1 Tax=Humulus lupulus TaxID=3486 RepID=UPI002B40C857|nr:pentatricopeptide repeat-containing protein At1g80270, mitochondrial-like [Humulus lupulus]